MNASARSTVHRFVTGTILPWLGVAAILLASLYLAAPALANFLLFHPGRAGLEAPPTLGGVAGEVVDDETEDGLTLRHWWYEAGPGAPAVVVFHGNAGHLGHRAFLAESLVGRGISVLLVGYRGYGASDGRPSERGLRRDGIASLELAASRAGGPERVVLLGRSLGAAVAAQVAARRGVAGLVLDSGFTSLVDIARAVYPFFPRFVLGRIAGRFDTLRAVEELHVPVLVIHGTDDEIIPFRMGKALHEAASAPKEWLAVPGARHNDLLFVAGEEYFDRVADFVHGVTRPGRPARERPEDAP